MGGILGGPKPAILATPPAVTPPARMPDPDDPAVREAKRRQVAQMLGGGRSSTILTGPGGDARAKAPPAGVASADSYAGTAL